MAGADAQGRWLAFSQRKVYFAKPTWQDLSGQILRDVRCSVRGAPPDATFVSASFRFSRSPLLNRENEPPPRRRARACGPFDKWRMQCLLKRTKRSLSGS